jgi:hypothetical protein
LSVTNQQINGKDAVHWLVQLLCKANEVLRGGRAMKYDVHIFAVARVKVAGIAAQSQAEAIVKAEDSVDLYHLFDNAGALPLVWKLQSSPTRSHII